jgi:PleD family two-component response regulator
MATRLVQVVREHNFACLGGEQITVSAGTSTFANNNVQSCDQLVQLADKAMYKAKSLGKDNVLQG